MKNSKFIIPILFYVLLAKIALAQPSSTINIYNRKNGLTQSSVLNLSFDADGFLWIGTYRGITRFDGTEFKRFYFDPSHKKFYHESNEVTSISHYKENQQVFIKTKIGNVYTIKNAELAEYKKVDDSVSSNQIATEQFPSIALFNKFNLANDELANKYHWSKSKRQVVPLNATDFIVSGQQPTSLFYYKNDHKEFEIQLENPVLKFLKSGRDVFFLDVKYNFFVYDSIKKEAVKTACFIGDKKLDSLKRCIFLWDNYNDEAYCYYNKTFYSIHYSPEKKIVELVAEFANQADDFLWTCILHDKVNGGYFVGAMNEGLCVFKKKWINVYKSAVPQDGKRDVYSGVNMAVLKINDSSVVFPSGLQVTKKRDSLIQASAGNLFSNIRTIAAYKDSGAVCGDKAGLYYYLKSDGFVKSHVYNEEFNRLNKDNVQMIYPEGDSLWVGTYQSLFCVSRKKLTVIALSDTILHKTRFYGISCIYRYSDNELWVSGLRGTYSIKTSPPYQIKEITALKGMTVDDINRYKHYLILSLYKDGLWIYDGATFQKIPVRGNDIDELSCNATYINHKTGFLWIITNNGLIKTKLKSLFTDDDSLNRFPFFYFYGKFDGVLNTEFSAGGMPSFAVLRNKDFFIPAMNGFAYIDSDKLPDSIAKTSLHIKNIFYNGEKIEMPPKDSIVLASNIDNISIDLNVPHFGEMENLNIEYNYDSHGWQLVSIKEGQIFSIANLKFGKHVLMIRKRIGFDNNDFQYRSFTIIKDKRYYEQWWFLPSSVIAFILIVFLSVKLYSYRINNHRKALQKLVNEQTAELSHSVEVKELLINIISHDMVAPLKYISLISGILEKGMEKDLKKSKNSMRVIKKTAEGLLFNSKSIIDWMKYSSRIEVSKEHINLYSTVEEMCTYFEPLANEKEITLINEIPKWIFIDMDLNVFNIILNNLISNAIKHSESKEVRVSSISISQSDINRIKIVVADKGIGISEELVFLINELIKRNIRAINSSKKNSTGMGYVLIGELAKVHNMNINLLSKLNEGTQVIIEMDLLS